MLLRLPIMISILLTLLAARCDNLHARSTEAALAAYEASLKAAVVTVCNDPVAMDKQEVLGVCATPGEHPAASMRAGGLAIQ